MRCAGSIYDNLRQPGVFNELARQTARRNMKGAVLARLRLDDLLLNDELRERRLVVSISDVVDGRLFTLFTPQDLDGVDLEILCRPRLADNPSTAVLNTVRSWIQNADGTGRPAFFMASADGSTRVDIAETLQSMSGLSVDSLQQARTILESAGMDQDAADALEAHWYNWHAAIARQEHRLKGFPRSEASAVSSLHDRLDEVSQRPGDFGLTDTGIHAFSEGLRTLEDNSGRRDAVTALFERSIARSKGTDRDELNAVRQIFYHHMFEAIATSNEADAEHSAAIGGEDTAALPEAYLIRLERYEDDLPRVHLDPRIVVALGGMSAADYKTVKAETASRIAIGVREFRKSSHRRGESGDLSRLDRALDYLAHEIRSTSFGFPGVGAFLRRYAGSATVAGGAVATAAAGFDIAFRSDPDPLTTAGAAAVGAVAGGIAKAVWDNTPWATLLLKRSLVKVAKRELEKADNPQPKEH